MNILDRYEDNKEYLRKLSEAKERVFLRRSRSVELNAKGKSQQARADTLHVAASTVNSDLQVLRRQARTNIQTYVEHQLPFEHNSLMVGITKLPRKAWDILEDEKSSEKAIANAMHLILNCYDFKRSLLVDMPDIQGIHQSVTKHQQELELQSLSLRSPRSIISGPEVEDGNTVF